MASRPTYCQSFLAFLVKFLNYLQTFVGVSIILYSALMLYHWSRHDHSSVPPPGPPLPQPQPYPQAPPPFYSSSSVLYPKVNTFADVTPLSLDLAADAVLSDLGLVDGVLFNIHSVPTPWFIFAFMGVGVVLCCIACIGHVAAEAINGCCLCFYAILCTLFVIVEILLVAFIAVDRQWEKILPVDSTGELDRLRAFFEENRDVFVWTCFAAIIIQVLSLLLSIILRALLNQKADLDSERAYDIRERPWEPLLHPHPSEASGSIRSDGRGTHSDILSSRMREKYGLNGGDIRQNLTIQNAAVDHDML